MKSNSQHTTPSSGAESNLHFDINKEKETLVSMFLASASHNELTEQIKKIDALCSRIEIRHQNNLHD